MDGNTVGIMIATFIGPIAAVIITRWVDRLRDKDKRRLEIFRSLMRTRRMPLSAEHVSAINAVEIEFPKDPSVITALRNLIEHFETGYGENKTLDELKAANDKTDALRTTLISKIAEVLGYKFEQMEIHRGGYTPRGWGLEFDEQTAVRQGLAALLSGQRVLPVTFVASPQNLVAQQPQNNASPFPPKPN